MKHKSPESGGLSSWIRGTQRLMMGRITRVVFNSLLKNSPPFSAALTRAQRLCCCSTRTRRTGTKSFSVWSIGCLFRPTAKRLFCLTFSQMPSGAQIAQQAELFVDPSRWAVRVGLFFILDKSSSASALSVGSMFAQVATYMFCMEAFTSLKTKQRENWVTFGWNTSCCALGEKCQS